MKKHLLSTILFTLGMLAIASCVKDRTFTKSAPPPINTGNDTVLYYWDFNTDSISAMLPTIGISASAAVSYLGASFDTVQPGTTVNAQGYDTTAHAGDAALRLRNPASGPFIIIMPTTGYKNIVLKFAEDHTTKGATVNMISYTVNGGASWKTDAISAYSTYNLDSVSTYKGFQLFSFDFSSDDSVNNNALFQVRIDFGTGATNTSGNDRFDNITLFGIAK